MPRRRPPTSPASGPSSSALKQEYDEAFQETMRKPADLDVLFRFASLATQIGDLEGAISALERMLLINQNLPRVRLELGVLYYRLGFIRGRAHLSRRRAAIAERARGRAAPGRGISRRGRQQAQPLQPGRRCLLRLALPVQRQSRPCGLACAAVRPDRRTSTSSGLGAADWGVVSSLQVRHRYDFGHQDKAALETQFTGLCQPPVSGHRPPTSRCST